MLYLLKLPYQIFCRIADELDKAKKCADLGKQYVRSYTNDE